MGNAFKYILGTILIIFGLVTFFNGLIGLPDGIAAMRQGNPAHSGAASGGIFIGPLIMASGIALWRMARRHAKLLAEPDISPADRMRNPDDSTG